jgi:LDH2 family malate/lactate/ureidoglycolate dehydrogenase
VGKITMVEMNRRFKADWLREYCSAILEKLALSRDDGMTVADNLVEADLRGVDSHGVTRLAVYAERLEAGLVNPRPQIKIASKSPTAVLMDGDNGPGAVVGLKAMEEAIKRAKQYGIAWVGVNNSNHFGAASYYVMRAVEEKCIGLAITNAPPTMPPWGGKSPFFGTNPFAVAIPAGAERPIVLDMATSVTARGKIILAAKAGETIPLGMAIDSEGRPTTDPQAALAGAVLPFGGHKGYGISLLVDILTGLLTGATYAPNVGGLYNNPNGIQNLGHGFAVISIDAFLPFPGFIDRMDHLIREVRNAPRAAGTERIYLPGEIEFELRDKNLAEGIALSPHTARELKTLGMRLGVSWPFGH